MRSADRDISMSGEDVFPICVFAAFVSVRRQSPSRYDVVLIIEMHTYPEPHVMAHHPLLLSVVLICSDGALCRYLPR